jgi:hypothetical protein
MPPGQGSLLDIIAQVQSDDVGVLKSRSDHLPTSMANSAPQHEAKAV